MLDYKEPTVEITQKAYMAIVNKATRFDLLKEYNKNNKYLSEWEKVIYGIHDEAEDEE